MHPLYLLKGTPWEIGQSGFSRGEKIAESMDLYFRLFKPCANSY